MGNFYKNSQFKKFHFAFWVVAGIALFISGYSQSNVVVSLTRNVYLITLGGGLTFLLAASWHKIPWKKVRGSWVFFLASAYLLGTLIIIPINPVTYGQLGIAFQDLTWRHIFAGSMNFSMVQLFWGVLCLFLFETGFRFPGGFEGPLIGANVKKKGAQPPGLEVENKEGVALIPLKDISHIKASADYVEIFLNDGGIHLKRATIQSLQERLKPHGFLQVHRSLIINMAALEGTEGHSKGSYTLIMANGQRLKSSRRYKTKVERILG